MKDFLFVFRANYGDMPPFNETEAAAMTKKWIDWISGMGANGNLVDRGNRLHHTGNVVRPGSVVTNGPYVDIKESIGGYTLVKAGSYEEAVELAKGCPVLGQGGNVEVREISPL